MSHVCMIGSNPPPHTSLPSHYLVAPHSWLSARDNPLVNPAAEAARVEGNRFDAVLLITCIVGSLAVSCTAAADILHRAAAR
jgi:hypothetical protein